MEGILAQYMWGFFYFICLSINLIYRSFMKITHPSSQGKNMIDIPQIDAE